MSRKRKLPAGAPESPTDSVALTKAPGVSDDQAISEAMLSPSITAALAIRRVSGRSLPEGQELTLTGVAGELTKQAAKVKAGDLGRPEDMLTTQAHTLDALFSDLIRLAYGNLSSIDAADRLFRLAFRAQNQARATLETLGALKNPPMVFAKQANVTTGPQQVNNGSDAGLPYASRARAHAGNLKSAPNKLLEQINGNRLDTRAAGRTGREDSELVPLDSIHRAENRRR